MLALLISLTAVAVLGSISFLVYLEYFDGDY